MAPVHNASGDSVLLWSGKVADLDGACDFVFGEGALFAVPFHTGSGVLRLDQGDVRPGDMIHRDEAGKIRVLVPVGANP